jgi:hypothetical protein
MAEGIQQHPAGCQLSDSHQLVSITTTIRSAGGRRDYESPTDVSHDGPAKVESDSMANDGASSDDLAKPVSSSVPDKFRGHHPPGVWESHKSEIRRLYIDKAMPLREVRSIMREKGFVAT